MSAIKNKQQVKKKVTKEKRKYQKAWEKAHPWVSEKNLRAYCHLCNEDMDPKKSRLTSHENSAKHKINAAKTKNMKPLTQIPGAIVISGAEEVKIVEMKLACEVAKHSPIMSVDHLTETITSTCVCSEKNCENPLKRIHLHRTKCGAIINNVSFLTFYKVECFELHLHSKLRPMGEFGLILGGP